MALALHLAENGVREVTLLGQNVNGYRGQTHDGRLADLAELIRLLGACSRDRLHQLITQLQTLPSA